MKPEEPARGNTAPRIDNRKDALLLLLLSPGKTGQENEPISGRTRLIKLIYLFYEELASKLPSFKKALESRHEFISYHFGPFSKDVYDDIEFLENAGLVREDTGEVHSIAEASEWKLFYDEIHIERRETDETAEENFSEATFRLTESGMKLAEGLYGSLTPREKKATQDFKEKYNCLSLNTLLRYIYKTYPEMTTKSRIKHFF